MEGNAMCCFDNMDPLDIAAIIGLFETLVEGEQEGQQQQKEPSDDIFEDYDPVAEDEQEEEETDYDDEA
jgi:hypothetical protein